MTRSKEINVMKPDDKPAIPTRGRGVSRREMLRQTGLVTVGLATTPVAGWPAQWFRSAETVVPFTDIPANFAIRRDGPERLPGENLTAQDLRDLTSWVTPIEDYFVVSHYGNPELDASSYRLQVDGLVDRPIVLTLDELKRRPRVERTTVFECGGNSRGRLHGMVGNATWTGADLRLLLEEIQPTTDAREVHFWGADEGTEEIRGQEYEQNFARSMSFEQIAETSPILAYEMNGQPLPVVHGFPVRLVVPGWYGVCQVKWLNRIDVSADRLMTRFMARDYVTLTAREVNGETEWIETSVTRQRPKSVIARVTRTDDQFKIFGAAWTDGTPLETVEVQIDDGSWRAATLERPVDPHSWTFFTLEATGLSDGEHALVSRATDVGGRTQPADLEMKRTRWENNELFHRTIMVG
ncbi:MAG: molybdopterin-dependent oxidoreductase [Gemmatimonadota bacterium]